MALRKITDADLVGVGVLGQPDTPNLSAREMQLAVEGIPREVLIPVINENAEAQDAINAAQEETNAQILRRDNTEAYTPGGDYQPATKKFVEDTVKEAVVNAGSVTPEMLEAVEAKADNAQQAAQAADEKAAAAQESADSISDSLGSFVTHPVLYTVLLTADGWEAAGDDSYTQTAGGEMGEAALVQVSPQTKADADTVVSCGVFCSQQGAGTLTFAASKQPEADITMNVVYWDSIS